jgi:hypothetical protein
MRRKRRYVASLDQVRITREKDGAVIEYAEEGIGTTHFGIGPEAQHLTDQEILDRFNAHLETLERLRDEYEHVAVEVPPGKPQIEYFEPGQQWTPRGGVLRCVIDGGGPCGEPVIHIDQHELSWSEFGRLLLTYEGWGMRVIFVPDDELDVEPDIEVRDPQEGK